MKYVMCHVSNPQLYGSTILCAHTYLREYDIVTSIFLNELDTKIGAGDIAVYKSKIICIHKAYMGKDNS